MPPPRKKADERLKLTPRGLALGGFSILLMVGGFSFGYPELVILGAAGAVALVGAIFTCLRPWRLEAERVVEPIRVVAGEPCQGVLTIRNKGRFLGVDVTVTDWCRYHGGETPVPVPILRLRADQQSRVRYDLPTSRRGVIDIGPLTVQRGDIFGLAYTRHLYADTQRVWVHPRPRILRGIPTGMLRSLDGRADKVEHGSITFHALREYVRGDDLRLVHWRTSARVGTLMVREHVDTSLPRVVVVVDDRETTYANPAAFEVAVEAAASIVAAVLNAGLAIDLHCVDGGDGTGTSLTGESAHQGREAYFDVLTEVELGTKGSLASLATRLRHGRRGDTLVVLTGNGTKAPPDDLSPIAGLRDLYPSVVVARVGSGEGLSNEHGMLIANVETIDDFIAAWDGVRSW